MLHFRRVLASWTIRNKFLLLLCIFFLPAFAIIVVSGLDHRKSEIAKAKDSATLLVHSIATQQEQIVIGTKQMFSTLAQLPEVKMLDGEACNKLFAELHLQYPFYTTIGATTPDGDVFAFSPPLKSPLNLSIRKHVRDAERTLDFSTGEFIVGRVSKLPSINYAYPVLDSDKKLLAILQVGFDLERFADFMKEANLPEGCAMGISDFNGVRLYRFPESDATPPGIHLPDEAFKHMQGDADQGIFEKVGEDNIDRFYAFKRLRLRENLPPYLYIAVGIPKEVMLQKANRRMAHDLLILGIAALAAMYLAWIIGNFTFVKPIKQLAVTTKRFAEGLMDTRTGLEHTPDELGQLAQSFDDMASLLEMRSLERKKAELELRENKEFLNLIIENIPDMVFVKDAAELRYVKVNRAAEDILGISREYLIGKRVHDFFSNETAELIESNERLILKSKRLFVFPEVRVQTGHRGERVLHSKKIPVFDSGGNPQYILGIAEDITERKTAEEALKRSEEQFRSWVKNAPDAIFVQIRECFAYVNKAAVELYGALSEDELLGTGIGDRLHPDFRNEIAELMRAANMEQGPAPSMEQKHLKLDGTTVHVEVHSTPIIYRGENGALVFVRDITRRKKTEEILKHSEERYSRLFKDAVLGIFRTSPDGKLLDVNPAFARMFGFESPEETVSQVSDAAVDLYVEPSRRNESMRSVIEAEGSVQVEHSYKRKDGSTFTGNLHARAVRDKAGNLLYIEGFIEDISERKWAEDERQILESRLRQSHKMEAIGTLAGGIAHDFNNILAAIIGYTEIALSESVVNDEVRQSLEQIMKAGLRAKDLVRQILVFSRMKVGQTLEPIDIGQVIREALRFFRASFPATIEIRENINGEEQVALADPTQIHQLITNLCTNALHAMEETGGIMEVSLECVESAPSSLPQNRNLTAESHIRLTVSDTGAGMEPSVLERIFDPYFTTKAPDKGSGLGLALVHGIVKRHNGVIEVRSEPMEGSTFSVYLPRVRSKAAKKEQEPSALPKGKETILFVDDEEALADIGKKMLQTLGYQVIAQTNCREALRLFTERPDYFDMVVTDYTMPNMTGADLAREILRLRPDIPIILSTGFTERITPEKAADMGIRELLMKPLNMRELARAVRRVLDNDERN
jgi:PAS domain S-box-containing protein